MFVFFILSFNQLFLKDIWKFLLDHTTNVMTKLSMSITNSKEMLVIDFWSLDTRAKKITILINFLYAVWYKTTSCCERIFGNYVPLNILKWKVLNISLNDISINQSDGFIFSKTLSFLAVALRIFRHWTCSLCTFTNIFVNQTQIHNHLRFGRTRHWIEFLCILKTY